MTNDIDVYMTQNTTSIVWHWISVVVTSSGGLMLWDYVVVG